VTTGSLITAALAGQGLLVGEVYAGQILGEWRATHPAPERYPQGATVNRDRQPPPTGWGSGRLTGPPAWWSPAGVEGPARRRGQRKQSPP
jgi:hypothetical protein